MSPEARVSAFVPSPLAASRADASASARAAGFAAGWAAGAREAATAAEAERTRVREADEARERQRDAEVSRAVADLARVAQAWRMSAVPVLDEAHDLVLDAALELAQAILGRELRPGPGSASALVERARALPAGLEPTAITVSVPDLPYVRRALADGEASLPEGISVVADAALAPGDLMVAHRSGVLDSRIALAVERARASLAEES